MKLSAPPRVKSRTQYEADLGKGFVKKRVAYPGKGKSGGARLLVAQRMKGLHHIPRWKRQERPWLGFHQGAGRRRQGVGVDLREIGFHRARTGNSERSTEGDLQ